jgi:hypothetical protein
MGCPAFTVNVKDVAGTVKKLKDKIEKNGGKFKGDEKKGAYSVSGKDTALLGTITFEWAINGSYTVDEKNNVKVEYDLDIDHPKWVTCKAAEKKCANG